jgi:sec-independent protein translocase protein TatC
MADELEVMPPESSLPEEEDEGGGPIKTFLEHLEDLRWTLIKSVLAVVIGVLACLSGAPWLIKVLVWPLEMAEGIQTDTETRVIISLGTNIVARMNTQEALAQGFDGVYTNSDTFLRMIPVSDGTNFVMSIQPDPQPPLPSAYLNSVKLSILGPAKAFKVLMQVGIYGGFVLSTPAILFFLAQFILPALHVHEKRLLYRIAGVSGGLFFLGLAFCYFLILIICLSTTVTFTNWLGFSAELWTADEYISFVCWFMLGMGIAFQLPLVLLTLVHIGILSASKLSEYRSYWVIIGLVLCAFITPDGSPITLLLLFGPLHLLYEASVIIAYAWERKARKNAVVPTDEG